MFYRLERQTYGQSVQYGDEGFHVDTTQKTHFVSFDDDEALKLAPNLITEMEGNDAPRRYSKTQIRTPSWGLFRLPEHPYAPASLEHVLIGYGGPHGEHKYKPTVSKATAVNA